MNLLGAGLPCVIAVIAVHLITLYFGLPRPHHLLLTLSFTLATIAPAYARFVNNHMMLLAVCAVLTLEMLRSSSFANPLPPALRGEKGRGEGGFGTPSVEPSTEGGMHDGRVTLGHQACDSDRSNPP